MRATSVWKKTLKMYDWTDFYKPPGAFTAYIKEESERIANLLDEMKLTK
jgi:tripartite-type tricarboxylate transporter receptor subunit TctC